MSDKQPGLANAVAAAAKWSIIAQLASKLIAPITTMVLARLLTPSAFGIVATATMVTSLGEMISDAGFQKYIVQRKFVDSENRFQYANVAFWANLAVAVMLVILIWVFRSQIAAFVGNPGSGSVIAVASLSLPVASLTGVQTALYQRDLDFRTLFGSRVGSSFVVFATSIALAISGFGYWSMVVGNLSGSIFLAIWLTSHSVWRPSAWFSFCQLREMLSYGLWVLAESILVWLNTWAGTFVLGIMMDSWSVGLYKTSVSVSSSVVGIFTAALLPIVFSSLSRLQDDDAAFAKVFYRMQRYLGICLIPLALGVFVYRDLFTSVLLGGQWMETALFLGLWTLASCIVIVFGYMCSEAYRAKGKPHYCVLVQALYLPPFLLGLYISASMGYAFLSICLPCVRLLLVVINLSVMKLTLGLSPLRMLLTTRVTYVQSVVAMLPGFVVGFYIDSPLAMLCMASISVLLYFGLVFAYRGTRVDLLSLVARLKPVGNSADNTTHEG